MPYNGSGSYSAPANSFNPAVGGTTISSADWNSLLSDLETALSSVITKDGQTVITANLPMAGFKHTGVNTNSGSTSRSEYASGATLQDGAPLDAGATSGTSTAYTATLTPAITAYANKQCFRWQYHTACGADPEINLNSVGSVPIYKNVGGTATKLAAGDVPEDFFGEHRYDSTLDSGGGGFWLLDSPGVSDGSITPVQLAASALSGPVNFAFTASVAANALTIAVKGEDGNDPSATNVVKIPFQDQSGGYDVLSITAATSLVVPDTATLGTTNGVLYRLWIVGFNDGGTFRLGICNTQVSTGIFPLLPDMSTSSTTIGTGSDSAGVIYSGTGVTDKPMVLLGYIEATEATAGTWATAPSKAIIWQKGMLIPGTFFHPVFSVVAAGSGNSDIPDDNTVPTSGEGTEVWSQAITVASAANKVRVQSSFALQMVSGNRVVASVFRGTTNIGVLPFRPGSDGGWACSFDILDSPATAGSVTYSIRVGRGTAGGTYYYGQDSSGSKYGGAIALNGAILTEAFA